MFFAILTKKAAVAHSKFTFRTRKHEAEGVIATRKTSHHLTVRMSYRSQVQKADQTINELCSTIQPALEKHFGKPFSKYNAVNYWQETSAKGTAYGIKIHLGDEYMHVYVTKNPQGETYVENVERGKTSSDTIL